MDECEFDAEACVAAMYEEIEWEIEQFRLEKLEEMTE